AKGWVTVINSVNRNGWTALGKWEAISNAPKKAAAAAVTTGDPSNDRPILHHGDAASSTSTPTPGPDTGASPSPTPQQEQASSSPQVDSERPVLRRRDSGNSSNPEPSSAPTPAASATPAKPEEGTVPKTKLPVIAAGTRTFIGISDTQS